jgi:hypothetical protein
MRGSRFTAIVLSVAFAASGQVAAAQSLPPAGPGWLELSFGTLWIGQLALGENDANQTTPTGGALKLFSTSTELASVAGLDARVAVRLLRSLDAEVEAAYGRPELNISISSDFENAAALTAREELQQFTMGAGAVWYLPFHMGTSRLSPFVLGGAGYLRQVHEERTLVETDQYYDVGGGVKWLAVARTSGLVNSFGVRVDVRAMVRRKGVAFDDGGHTSPAIGASAFVRF